jgi:ferritin-like metal-binding protein YciE
VVTREDLACEPVTAGGQALIFFVNRPESHWSVVTRAPGLAGCGIHQPQIAIIMPTITSPRELLVEELKDLYSAETQLTKTLPKLAKAATNPELKTAFETHLEETEVHVERLEKVMNQLGESPKGKKCKAMEGLVAEGKEIMEEDATPAMLDLAMIGAAQKVEHYEIAGYGTARTLAELAGEGGIAEILQETLDEEGMTDKRLTDIAGAISLETVNSENIEE